VAADIWHVGEIGTPACVEIDVRPVMSCFAEN